jgi:hypothetical protein
MVTIEVLPSPADLTQDSQLHAHLQKTGPKNGRLLPSSTIISGTFHQNRLI